MASEQYTELVERLDRVRRRQESVSLLAGVFNAMTGIVVLVLAAMVAEMVGHFGITGRTLLFWLVLGLSVLAVAGFIVPPLLERFGIRHRASDDELAIRIGSHFSAIHDSLLNALQLARPMFEVASTGSATPSPFALAAFAQTYPPTRSVDFTEVVNERRRNRALMLLLSVIVIASGTLGIFGGELLHAGGRILDYSTFYQKPAPFTFVVRPGSVRVMRGDTVRIVVRTDGEQLRTMHLQLREEGATKFEPVTIESSEIRDSSVRPVAVRREFVYAIRALHPIEYFAEAQGIESDHSMIEVLDHPIIRSLRVQVIPPSYTGIRPMMLAENIGDISGTVGTRGDFRVTSSKPLRSAWLVFTPTVAPDSSGVTKPLPPRRYSLAVSDSSASGAVAFVRSGSYHVELLDRDSIASEHPIEYTVRVTPDEKPAIVLLQPTDRADVPSSMRVDMLARIHDDFGFRGVRLAYRLSKSTYQQPDTVFHFLDMPLSSYNTQDLDVPYIWNLTPMALSPEDEVTYYLEVTDNDAVTGPKHARTPEYVLRLPSVKEIFERAQEQASGAERDLKEIHHDAEDLQKKVNEAVEEMKQLRPSDMVKSAKDFAKQKDLQQLAERQNALQERLKAVAKDLQSMASGMEQQNALSPETMKEYAELQKLFQQINSPELKAAMDRLQQVMQQQQVNPQQLQDAMQHLQSNEEQFRKSIERTANILKKIQAEQKVDELMKRAGALANQEQKAAESAQSSVPKTPEERAAASREQADAQKELARMQQDAKALEERLKQLPKEMQAPEQMAAAQKSLSDPSIQSDMQQSAEANQRGDQQSASSSAKSAASKMRQAQQKLASLKQQLDENQRQRDMREMRGLRDELTRLSKEEEKLRASAANAVQNSSVFRDLADKQSQTQDALGRTASKALQMAQRSTAITPEMGKEMGKAFNAMQQSVSAMTNRNQASATDNSQSAMSSLNRAAQQMQQAMNSMAQAGQSGGSGGEGNGQASGSSGGQGGSTPSGQGGSGSALQQFLNQINQATAQQQAIANQMQSMAQSGNGGSQTSEAMMQKQAELSRLAARQQAVQKSVEQMAEEQKSAQTGSKLASEKLQKIADDMQEVISQMQHDGLKPETIQRQERILSRLLDAERSVHERDKDPERESTPGQDYVGASPEGLKLSTPVQKNQLDQSSNQSNEHGFSQDYDELVRKYLEQLERTK